MLVSEQFPEVASLSPFSRVGPRALPPVMRFGGKWPCSLSHLASLLLAFVVQGIPKGKSLRPRVEQVKDRVRSMIVGAEL